MGKRKLQLQTGYIADAIMQTRKKKFNEKFTTIDEVNIIKQVIEKRIEEKSLNVKFVDGFFERYFEITNGIITKIDEETVSLRQYISATTMDEMREIQETIYDENLIYLCLCEIMTNKLNNSIEHNCSTCNTECCHGLSPEKAQNCYRWSHDFNNEKYKIIKKTLGR